VRVLIASDFPGAAVEHISNARIRHRPDLLGARESSLASALNEARPNVLIAEREPGEDVVRSWLAAMNGEPVVLMCLQADGVHSLAGGLPSMYGTPPDRYLAAGVPVYTISLRTGKDDQAHQEMVLLRALAVAERFLLDAAHMAGHDPAVSRAATPGPVSRADTANSIILIGAGIVNLVTAHFLAERGFHATIVDAGPDPRLKRPWQEYGCTRGGGNARMFTLTEADDYHDRSTAGSPESNNLFDGPPALLGWDVRSETTSAQDRQWVQEFKRIPPWLARAYNNDIFGLNRRSGELWQTWLESQPELFDDVTLRHGILRLYEDPGDLVAGAQRQSDVGAMLERYHARQVRDLFPALAEAAPDAFAGGVLVRGFTVNVHDFMARLLDRLDAAGTRLCFGQRVERVLRDGHDVVTGVLTADGLLEGDHYVASPGAYGGDMLSGTRLAGAIQGVLGCWVSVPNGTPPLENSLKVARHGHVADDANVTVGHDESGHPALIVGSGYGWTGADPANVDEHKLRELYAGVLDTARRLFPRAFEMAGGDEALRSVCRFCVRPWTSSNLGLFATDRARNGVFIMTGGHNTGGFAQAPVIAEAVVAALHGRRHPMHVVYAPQRTEQALGPLAAGVPRPAAGAPQGHSS
jgi:glycine/D-amino acid oxidase-like deaminating enzyme